MTANKSTTQLTTGWKFKQASGGHGEWRSVKHVPSEVFLDLLEHDLIPDPFDKKNELLVQWVGEEDWAYRVSFPRPNSPGAKRHELVFEGLDTYATVTLNGTEVLKSENMHLRHRVDITGLLKDKDNDLEILFTSAFITGKKIKEKYPDFHWGCWNGDPSRLAVRKAQYHYGWDWGPTLLTAGPWRPVYIESFTARLAELYFTVDVDESLKSASIKAVAEIAGDQTDKVVFTLTDPSGQKIKTGSAEATGSKASIEFVVDDPELWWPHGYGVQPRYTLTASIPGDSSSHRLGIRRARVVQRPLVDAPGKTFFFEINNSPIFAVGSNWIPADSFLTRVGESTYRRWLSLLKDGGQNMVRVWAGGIYESNTFYDICDEFGILVWQDFLFGCGNYPAMIPELRSSVRAEAEDNIKRLRHHPSLVIFAGNNEDYSYIWGQPGRLGYDAGQTNPEDWLKTGFPARYIYEKILPDAVAAFAPGHEYHPGSPWGSVERPAGDDNTVGDMHQWNVWHGSQEPYQNYDKLAARFVSEFGMEAFPSIKTVNSYLPPDDPAEHHAFSETVEFHNKADGAERRIALYLADNLTFKHEPLEAYIYSTQLMQSEALGTAYRLWRRNWKGEGREYTAGALVWQLNDCWPVTSWSIVDYSFVPKISYYSIKRCIAPVIVAAKRDVKRTPKNPYTNAHVDIEHRIQIWVSTFLLSPPKTAHTVTAKAFKVPTGELIAEETLKSAYSLPANRTEEVADIVLPGWKAGKPDDASQLDIVVALYVRDAEGKIVARDINWPEPLKYLDWSEKQQVRVKKVKGGVSVEANAPVKGLVLESEGTEGWEDQGVDVVPGERVVIGVAKVGKQVVARWLGKEEGVKVTVE